MKKIISTTFFLFCAMLLNAQTVAILGDSYSTYEDYLTPDTNAVWYKKTFDKKRTDVADVTQTWWWQVVKEGGFKLGQNNSFSGATICYTGYRDEDYKDRSFVTRLTNLGCPDIIFVFGGTNDSWCGAQVGEYKYEDFRRADLYFYRPALACLFSEMQKRYPNVEIYFILNSELRDDITSSTLTICKHYAIPCIQLHDIDKMANHPSIKGMRAIADQVLAELKRLRK